MKFLIELFNQFIFTDYNIKPDYRQWRAEHDLDEILSLVNDKTLGLYSRVTSLSDDVNEDNNLGTNPTIYNYINVLQKIFVLEDSHAWNPNLRSKTAIRTTDTRYFTDSSIAAAALGLYPNDLIDDIKTMGFFFENLCVAMFQYLGKTLDIALTES